MATKRPTPQSASKMNSKKKRRLDKYIEKKLKQEERVHVFEKLSRSQAQLPTSLHLQSSSTLGTGRVSTNRERIEKLEDKEVRRAIEGRIGKRRRHNSVVVRTEDPNVDEDGSEGSDVEETKYLVKKGLKEDIVVDAEPMATSPSTSSAVGSALQRNADGSLVTPRMMKAKTKGKTSVFRSWKHESGASIHPTPVVGSDTSFDSSDSAYDSEEDEAKDEGGDGSTSGEINSQGDVSERKSSPVVKPKRIGFKDWALTQLSVAKGYGIPTSIPAVSSETSGTGILTTQSPPKRKRIQPTEIRGPLGEDLPLPNTSFTKHLQSSKESSDSLYATNKIKYVTVSRPVEVEQARMLLPIVTEEQPIMEAVLLNPVVIICGETGSGKTTQVPQFLYEAGFGCAGSDNPGMIGVTQPRRVAAMSMAARVAQELSLTSSKVSYQIRYDATVSPSTSIKFMTDGVLLRELATDFLLTKYSVVIIDEAHERSMNTDILIGVLSRVLKLREEMWKTGKEGVKPLRLIIMSATLRISDFAENKALFPLPPPVINVTARQYPVNVHFNRRTPSDYVTEAIKKVTKIHARLPPGGILIFLTGENEIAGVCKKLKAKFSSEALEEKKRRRGGVQGTSRPTLEDGEATAETRNLTSQVDIEAEDVDLGNIEQDDIAFDVDNDLAHDDPDALDSDGEEEVINRELDIDVNESDTPMHILPLYSLLPSEKQMLVFQPPPPGSRLVVVSTNVAETSLTIPGIRYVVDCGRAKERRYDITNGIQAFQVGWISKASAAQRSGRAGRTGPGHCYRLYSSALFEHQFKLFSQPEILRMPIEGIVLQMKSMHIDAVVNFPFPTPPDRHALQKAESVLTHLGALGIRSSVALKIPSAATSSQITELGKIMSLFPLSPRFSRMLASGQQHNCLPYVISIVSALSVGDPFMREETLGSEESKEMEVDGELSHINSEKVKEKEAQRLRRRVFFQLQHTHSSLGNFTSDVFRILSVVGAYEYAGGGHQFCAQHFVRPKAMEEIHKLRAQISNIVRVNFPGVDPGFSAKVVPPSELQLKVLRQLLTAGFIDQVAVRKDLVNRTSTTGVQYANSKGVPYSAVGIPEDVFIHPSSLLASQSPPEYVVFNEVVRTTRIWIKCVTVVNPTWISSLGKSPLLTHSKPMKNSAGVMMVIPRFGPDGWELPAVNADVLR